MADRAGDIAVLIKKYVSNQLTEIENERLIDWVNRSEENKNVFNELTKIDSFQTAVKGLYVFRQTKDKT